MKKNQKRVMLIILDGWGIAKPSTSNAIYKAKTPTIDELEKSYFAASLQASGIAVGLPWGQAGNSEVGHMNMGAGYIVYQYLPRITQAIRDGSFYKNKALLGAILHAKRYKSRLHIMGLLGTGTVHSSIDHLYAILDLATRNGLKEVVVHIFTDGKDSSDSEGAKLVSELEKRLQGFHYKKIGSVIGRIYAMDRNNNWDLTKKAYDLLALRVGTRTRSIEAYLKNSYKKGARAYNIEAAVSRQNGEEAPAVAVNDALIFFNFREDSALQLTKAFVMPDSPSPKLQRASKIKNLYLAAFTEYEKNLPIEVAYSPPQVAKSLTRVLADERIEQLHISESEKYAHVTYFFNGKNEKEYRGEKRILIKSEGSLAYEQRPKMKAYEITQKILENIENFDFFLVNLANADILGHTGNFEAVVEGVEEIDKNLSALVEAARSFNITLIITSDHGNAEEMRDPQTGEAKPEHTANPVPLYIFGEDYKKNSYRPLYEHKPSGILADIAPTVLKIMGIEPPPEMTGKSPV